MGIPSPQNYITGFCIRSRKDFIINFKKYTYVKKENYCT